MPPAKKSIKIDNGDKRSEAEQPSPKAENMTEDSLGVNETAPEEDSSEKPDEPDIEQKLEAANSEAAEN